MTVLVVGDVMLDVYASGEVLRISPDAPVPVLSDVVERARPSGALIAAAAASEVADVVVVGVVGADAAGTKLTGLASSREYQPFFILDASRRTTVKRRYVTGDQHLLRVDEEDRHELYGSAASDVLEVLKGPLQDCRSVLLSDYVKGVVTAQVAAYVTNTARHRGIPVVVDSKRRDLARFASATVLTPNEEELSAARNLGETDAELAERLDASALVVTEGRRGARLVLPSGEQHQVSDPRSGERVCDVSGAGDVLAGQLAAHLSTAPTALLEATKAAVCAAANHVRLPAAVAYGLGQEDATNRPTDEILDLPSPLSG